MTMEPVRPSVQSHPSLVHSSAATGAGAKPRKTNFTAREVDVLLSSVRRRREAVLFGVAGGRGWAKAWHEVAAAVSSVEGIMRTEGDVRKKWTYLKWEAKNTSKPGRDPTSRAVLDILTGGAGGGSGSTAPATDHHHHHHVAHTHHLQQHHLPSPHHLQPQPQQQQQQQHHMSRQPTAAPSAGSSPASRNLLEDLLVPQPPPAQKQPNLQPPQQQTQKILPPQQVTGPKPIAPKPPPVAQPVSPLQPLPPPPEVCLRWNSYHSNMQATFPSLLNNEQFVDVTLACEGRSIKCHKMMLSACSAYFEELLSQNPCQHPIVLMKDLRYWEVQALVDFMYRGEVNVGQDKLPSLLAAAEALQIKGLAGPAFSSNDDDNSQAAAPASTNEDYLDESTPSPSSARRARKRRVMSSTVAPRVQPAQSQQVPTSPKNTAVKRSSKPVSVPSTSSTNYELENLNLPLEPPSRRPRKSEADLVGEIKIEPIDIEISNDSMDQIEDSFLDKPYDESEAGEESNCLSNDPGGTDSKNIDLGDTMKSLRGHETDQIDYGTNNSTSGSDQNFKYEDSGSQDAGLATISDMPGTSYQESLIQPSSSGMNNSSSKISDSLLGHM